VFAALILVATYVSIGRYYIYVVEENQQVLLARLNQFAKLPFSVERIHGQWSKLFPVLIVENLTLPASNDPEQSVLTIGQLTLRLDPLASLFQSSLQIKQLSMDGVECSLEETRPGKWQLKSYSEAKGAPSNVDNLIDLILKVDVAELLKANIAVNFAKGSDAIVNVKELSLKRADDFRRVKVEANFDQSEKPVLGVVEAWGDPRDSENFSAKAYLAFNEVDFSAHLPAINTLNIDMEDARLDGQLWLDWKPNNIIELQGSIATPLLNIAVLSGQPLAPLENFQINFRAEKKGPNNWSGWVPLLAMDWQQQSFKFEQLEIDVKNKQLGLSIPTLDMANITQQLLALDLLGGRFKQTLNALSPTGNLHQLTLSLLRNSYAEKVSDFILQANLDNIAVNALHGAPGATGVNGYLQVGSSDGFLELETKAFALDFPRVYRQPLAFDAASGKISWQITQDRVYVDSSPLYLAADHGPVVAQLNLDLPNKLDSDRPPEMILRIGLTDTAASYRDKFIPYTLNQDFLDWMSNSVPQGQVIDGGFIYRGSLAKGDINNRTAQLYLNIENTTLDYHPEWPEVTAIRGLVEIDNGKVNANIADAKIYDMAVTDARVTTTAAEGGGIWLTVDAKTAGESSDAIKFVNHSALQRMVGNVFNQWQLQGKTAADISLGLPLAGAEQSAEIMVAVELFDTDITMPTYGLQFADLNGPLTYSSQQGIYSSVLHANLYNKPLVIDVGQDEQKSLLINFSGRADMHDVMDWSQQAVLSFATGETDIAAQIKVDPTGESEFTLSSSLLGVDIDWPAPYKKSADSKSEFWLKLPLGVDQSLLRMGIVDVADMQLRFDKGQLESGLVILADANNTQHEAGFLVVTGSIDHFILSEWQQVFANYNKANAVLQQTKDDNTEQALSIKVRELLIENFSGFEQTHKNSMVSFQRWQDAWWLTVENNFLAGEFFIADDSHSPLKAKLRYIKLPESSVSGGLSSVSLESLREQNLDFSVEQLFLDDELYGSLSFELRPQKNGLIFNNISGDMRGILMDKNNPVTLEWLQTEYGEQTRLYGQFAFTDFGDVLEHWNYQRIIESNKGHIDLDLTWPGALNQWSLLASRGPLNLLVEDGRFLTASDTASGTLKVVSIVNLPNIIRRLKLDFSDLYKSGVSYDRIEGEMMLEDDKLKIVKDLTVETPSSGFALRGNADLQTKQLDMALIATLPVADNLPWVAGLAGGLPAVAGVYVASKIFGDQFDRLSSAVYSIDGDWNDYQLKFEKIYDNKQQ